MATVAEEFVNRLVLPGDTLGSIKENEDSTNSTEHTRLGPGIIETGNLLVACKAGILRHRKPAMYWIDTNQRRYVPVKDESVIGIMTGRAGENNKIDIGSSLPASLGNLAFEGATKRNHPNLQIGDLVYCKLSIANKDMEPEITCVDAAGKSNGLGILSGGFMLVGSLGLARKLLSPDCLVLKLLGKSIAFEITVGMNGRIWIKTKSYIATIAIANCIESSEFMDDTQVKRMVDDVLTSLRGF